MNSRWNLTIIQCVLYFIIGYVMYEYLTWGKMMLLFTILLGIQTITRIKSIADGVDMAKIMIYVKENMDENDVDKIDDMLKKMKDTIRNTDKKNWN
jgi:Zn-dependent M16 (insulinase) family peptidase